MNDIVCLDREKFEQAMSQLEMYGDHDGSLAILRNAVIHDQEPTDSSSKEQTS